ncbi:MAG TPA: FtsX-like permease family protein [Chloroflexota bacterium]|nr:FtsX-like permease family protein [Chloroflexota bacterium]
MSGVTLRGLFSRKLRTILTMIAIVLGVSMISGTYMLTDTINTAFNQIFQTADRNIDAVVVPTSPIGGFSGGPTPPLPASVLALVRHTPGVAFAEGDVGAEASIYDLNGNAIGAVGGAPTLLFSVAAPRFRSTTLVSGHWPVGNQLVIDKTMFAKHHLHLGQVVKVIAAGPATRMTIVGTTRFGSTGNLGGAATIDLPLAVAQRVTAETGKFNQISVAAVSGVTPADIVQRIRAEIPHSLRGRVKVETGTQSAQDASSAISNGLQFLTIALLVFGGIAVFVGAFIIFNTFSITIAQRVREIGLLRTLGATRAQILRSVLLEAFLIGLVSSLLGLLAGIGLAQLIHAVFKAFGADLPSAGLVLEVRTVIVAILVGVLVTMAAGFVPALRATRVPPIAALREGAQLPRSRFARFTPWIAGIVGALGVLVLIAGVFASISSVGTRLSIIGAGAVLLFLGVAMVTPKLVRPLAAALGWPIERMTRITGMLARDNASRNPTRTAVTAAALMIGLALVSFVTIFAAELRASADAAVNREIAGIYSIYNDQGQPIPRAVAPAVARIPGVGAVSALDGDAARVNGSVSNIYGIQPSTILAIYRFQWKQGSDAAVTGMGPLDALVSDTFASGHKVGVGSSLRVTTATDRHLTVHVVGIYKSSQFLTDVTLRYDTVRSDWSQGQDEIVSANPRPGANQKAVQRRITALLKSEFPIAAVHSQQQIKQNAEKSVNQLLTLIYVLLAMSVLVSLFGIINTLVLSIYERTREIGMLRAIGTTRGQVRWIVRWESVITAVIGAILGLAVGILLAAVVTQGLSSQGIVFTLPIGSLLIWVVFAMLFGIVAAAWPARRAARLDILQAIAYE